MKLKKLLFAINFIIGFSFVSAGGFPLSKGFSLSKTNKKALSISSHQKKINLITEDGINRNAILTLRNGAKANIVICHPASKNKEYMKDYEEILFKDYNCIRFDFRRHGENSDTQYSTIGKSESYEVLAATEVFKNNNKTKNLPIYGFGVSMGAAALIEAENKKPMFNGLILQSCYDKLRTQIKSMFILYRIPFMDNFIFIPPVSTYAKLKYRIKLRKINLIREIKKINIPIFLIHAQNDSFIPFKAFKNLKKASHSIKKEWTPKYGEHTGILKTFPKLYTEKCNEFIDRLQGQELKSSATA